MSGKIALAAFLTASLALAACRAGPEQREGTLTAAGRADSVIAHGPVVRDLRSPPESTRILYTRPTPLALPAATAAPAGQVSAPVGSSAPDTATHSTRAGTAPAPGVTTRPPRTH